MDTGMNIEKTKKVALWVNWNFKRLFGFDVGYASKESIKFSKTKLRSFFEMPIEQDFGIFAMVIKDAVVSVSCEEIEDAKSGIRYWTNITLSYNHPRGGRNGSTVGTIWFNEAGEVVDHRVN